MGFLSCTIFSRKSESMGLFDNSYIIEGCGFESRYRSTIFSDKPFHQKCKKFEPSYFAYDWKAAPFFDWAVFLVRPHWHYQSRCNVTGKIFLSSYVIFAKVRNPTAVFNNQFRCYLSGLHCGKGENVKHERLDKLRKHFSMWRHKYSVFHQFRQAKFVYGGSILHSI